MIEHDWKFVDVARFCQLVSSWRHIDRFIDRKEDLVGLRDRVTGEVFVIKERDLLAAFPPIARSTA